MEIPATKVERDVLCQMLPESIVDIAEYPGANSHQTDVQSNHLHLVENLVFAIQRVIRIRDGTHSNGDTGK